MILVVLRLLSNTRGSQSLVTLSRMLQIVCRIRVGRSVCEEGKEEKRWERMGKKERIRMGGLPKQRLRASLLSKV